METLIIKLKESKFVNLLDKITSSYYYALILVAINLITYYLSLDIIMIYVIGLNFIYFFLLKKDLTNVFIPILCISTIVSKNNSPSTLSISPSSYYYNPVIYIQIIIIISLMAISVFLRLIQNIKNKAIKINQLLISTLILSLFFITNSIFSNYYSINNTLYGLMLVFFFLILPYSCFNDIHFDKDHMKTLSLNVLFFSLMLVIELGGEYIFNCPIKNGTISKDPADHTLFFGWGMWNTIGFMFNICLPFILYLAYTQKRKYLYLIYSFVLVICVFFTASKQSYIMTALIALFSLIFLIIKLKGKAKIIPASIIGVGVLGVGLLLITKKVDLLTSFTDFFYNSDSRIYLYEDGIQVFLANPIFGGGFFDHLYDGGYAFVGITNIIPPLVNNTIIQMAESCGALGLISYIYYRVMTIKGYVKDKSTEGILIIVSVSVILIMSLLDIHLFNIYGTIIYSYLISYSIKAYN